MDTKKAVWTMVICGAVTAGLLSAPKIILDNVPTATIVEVEKIEHTDSVELTGAIKKISDNTVNVQVYVPEQDISKICIGQTAEITGDAFPDKMYLGTVEEISDIASKVTFGSVQKTAVEVTVKIDEPDNVLKHGYTSTVKFITSEPSTMTIVPYEAVNQDDNGEFVYILNSGKAEKRYVETGAELSEGIELKTVLAENECIITLDELIENSVSVKLSE